MFSGIVESVGKVESIEIQGGNKLFKITSPLSSKAYIDQSITHNGVCLTVIQHDDTSHSVVAVDETLHKSNLNGLVEGSIVNLEKSITANKLLDGHIVQGHVDTTGTCQNIKEADGSWYFTFSYDSSFAHLLVAKGSVTINGVSLTVIDPSENSFSVAIIPYTYEHTNFKVLQHGDKVNLEFDIIGKYVARQLELRRGVQQ